MPAPVLSAKPRAGATVTARVSSSVLSPKFRYAGNLSRQPRLPSLSPCTGSRLPNDRRVFFSITHQNTIGRQLKSGENRHTETFMSRSSQIIQAPLGMRITNTSLRAGPNETGGKAHPPKTKDRPSLGPCSDPAADLLSRNHSRARA